MFKWYDWIQMPITVIVTVANHQPWHFENAMHFPTPKRKSCQCGSFGCYSSIKASSLHCLSAALLDLNRHTNTSQHLAILSIKSSSSEVFALPTNGIFHFVSYTSMCHNNNIHNSYNESICIVVLYDWAHFYTKRSTTKQILLIRHASRILGRSFYECLCVCM